MSRASLRQSKILPITFDGSQSFAARAEAVLGSFDVAPCWVDAFGARLREWHVRANSVRPRVLSLFSGAGGLDIGFHDAGFEVVKMIELEADFVKTLKANTGRGCYFQAGEPICLDVRSYFPAQEDIDFIIGGPPCQTFSAAGRRASGVDGTQEPKGMLFAEYARILKAIKPIGFLFENVYGMTGAEGGKSMGMVTEAFEELGYSLFVRVLDAADYGVPQHRERLIIVGLRQGEFQFPAPTHGPDSEESSSYWVAGDALRGCCSAKDGPLVINGRHGHLLHEIPPGLNYSYFTTKLGHPRPLFAWRSKFSDYLYKADPDEPVRTIKAQGGQYTGPFHWDSRKFSLSEIKRLQTFPDRYTMIGGRQRIIQQLGNSVPPQLARILGCAVIEQVFGSKLPFRLNRLLPSQQLGFRKRKRERTEAYLQSAKLSLLGVSTDGHEAPTAKFALHAGPSGQHSYEFSQARCELPYRLSATISPEEWKISVKDKSISPPDGWNLVIRDAPDGASHFPAKRILLEANALDIGSYACAWRSFEFILKKYSVRDDLVQLFGYYQYKTDFILDFQTSQVAESVPLVARFARALISWKLVGMTLHEDEICGELSANKRVVKALLTEARRHGIEVRTHGTNPQIPLQHILIPYPFPTLNSQSVKARKQLF